jgi:drug/metabolite transporter (DMT)-like permease
VLGAAFAGVWCYAVGALIDFHALELIDVSLERSLLFSYPAIVVLYTAVTTRRFPSRAVVGAVVMTYVGILLVVGGFDPAAWQRNLVGASMVLFCATTTATYFLIGERTMLQLGSTGFTIIAMVAATVATLLICLPYHPVDAALRVSGQGWLLLTALAVLCMFLPTLMQAAGIQRIGAVRGALVSTVGPPAALLMGAAMLGERPGAAQLAGTALIVTGVVVIGRSGARAAPRD